LGYIAEFGLEGWSGFDGNGIHPGPYPTTSNGTNGIFTLLIYHKNQPNVDIPVLWILYGIFAYLDVPLEVRING